MLLTYKLGILRAGCHIKKQFSQYKFTKTHSTQPSRYIYTQPLGKLQKILLFSVPAEICLTEHLTSGSHVHMSSHEHNKSPVLTHQYKNSVCVCSILESKTLCYLKLQSIKSIIIWNYLLCSASAIYRPDFAAILKSYNDHK